MNRGVQEAGCQGDMVMNKNTGKKCDNDQMEVDFREAKTLINFIKYLQI